MRYLDPAINPNYHYQATARSAGEKIEEPPAKCFNNASKRGPAAADDGNQS